MPGVRLRSIDFLRGVAALGVALGHAVVAAPYANTDIGTPAFRQACTNFGLFTSTGVALFFVISGFCIHQNYARESASTGRATFRWGAFWRRRIRRLYPTYFVMLCVSMGIVVALYIRGTGVTLWSTYPDPKATWMGLDFLTHALMLHGLFATFDTGGGNVPFWTLAREEYLYLLYPLVLVLDARLRRVWVATLMMGATLLLSAHPTWPYAVGANSAPALWIQWYLGVVAADAYCGRVRLPAVFSSLWVVPVWMVAAHLSPSPGLNTICWGMAYFVLVNACVRREAEGRWPDRGVFAAITAVGVMSYSLYLVHFPVENILLAASLRLGSWNTPALFLLRAVLLTVGACLAATVLFRLVESRCLHRGDATRPRPCRAVATSHAG